MAGRYRGNREGNPLEVMFKGNQEAIRAYLHGRSAKEVAEHIDRTQECVRGYFKRYGVPLTSKCPKCNTTEDLTSSGVCRTCIQKPDFTQSMAQMARVRMSDLEGIWSGRVQPNIQLEMCE